MYAKYSKNELINFVQNTKQINQIYEINNCKKIFLWIQKNIWEIKEKYKFSLFSWKTMIYTLKGNNYWELIEKLNNYIFSKKLLEWDLNYSKIIKNWNYNNNVQIQPQKPIPNKVSTPPMPIKQVKQEVKKEPIKIEKKLNERDLLKNKIIDFEKKLAEWLLKQIHYLNSYNWKIQVFDKSNEIIREYDWYNLEFWQELLASYLQYYPQFYEKTSDFKQIIVVNCNDNKKFIYIASHVSDDSIKKGDSDYVFNSSNNLRINKMQIFYWLEDLFSSNWVKLINSAKICKVYS